MQISILANNPNFIERNGALIRQHALDSDIIASIKFKFIEPLLELPIKRHDIYFRSDPRNFLFGLEDYRHLIGKVVQERDIYLINDSERPDFDTANDTQGIRFIPFDKGPIEMLLASFENEPVFETIVMYAGSEHGLDMRRLSTGLLVVLHYSLKYPEAMLYLLGFFERGNQKVLKDGRTIRDASFHDFDVERRILQALAANVRLIN